MKVELTYFKRDTGKYYASAAYESKLDADSLLEDYWSEIAVLERHDNLPGLARGVWTEDRHEFIILVNVIDHPNAHPRLLV